MVKYLSFHNSSFTLRYILFNVNGKASSVTHLVLLLCKCELFWALCCKQKFPSHKHKLCEFNLSSVLNFYVAYFRSNLGNLLLCSWWSVEKKPLMSSGVHITKVVSQCLEFRCTVWELLNLNTFCY